MDEENDIAFASTHKGAMHACGHDGHMATLLGFAEYLTTVDTSLFKHNILMIFQPAEESPGGAKDIVESGLLQKCKVKAIFGLHLFPKLDEGVVGSRSGGFMAKASEINVDITGKSGHCGQPQNGIDSIQVAMKFLDSINFLTTKALSPFDPSLISFNKIVGGTVRNITAENTRLEGTIRSYSTESFNYIVDSLKRIGAGLELAFGAKFDFDIAAGYPPVVNDKEYYDILASSLSEVEGIEFRELEPEMLAEDFSFYQEAVPGVFYYVGVGTSKSEYSRALHNCKFNFDESALEIALTTYIKLNEKLNKI
jgi:amidohydrolase